MTSLNTATKTGAATIRRTARRSPLEVLYSLKQDDRSASSEILFRKWRKAVEADDDLMEAVLQYTFKNLEAQCEAFINGAKPNKLSNRQVINERRERIANMAKQVKKIIYLDLVMPNEKPMKACTFKEVSTFGDSFKLIAAQGKPSQLVGDVLTNTDIQKLLAGEKK